MNIFSMKNFHFHNNLINRFKKINFSFSSKETKANPFVSRLKNRSLLILNGPDTFKLLQGLTTNDINLLKPTVNKKNLITQKIKIPQKVSLYTLFLSPKGKLITDAYIYRPKVYLNGTKSFSQDQLWIDVDSSIKRQLYYHLQKYMWKKQVQLIDVEKEQDSHKPSIYVGYNHISTFSSYLDSGCEIEFDNDIYRDQEYSNLMMFDPRGGSYGRRIICMQEQIGLPLKEFKQNDQENYNDYQRTLGFTPSNLSAKRLPFQFNFDLLNAISFKKGCYLGQQIVSRSYFTGIVRRRVFPFLLKEEEAIPLQQLKEIKEERKLITTNDQELGKVIFYEKGKTGLALINYLQFFDENASQSHELSGVQFKLPVKGYIYCPFQKQLAKYLLETKKKQKNLEQLDI